MEKQKNKQNKILLGIIVFFCTFIVLYLGVSTYFINHFYMGSAISCINVSGKTVEEVEEQMSLNVGEYTLQLEERGNNKEQIIGTDINLKYNPEGKVRELKDKQNPYKWIVEAFDKKELNIKNVVTYDDALLKKCVDNLSCFYDKNIIEPKNPTFEYVNNEYAIVNEVSGTKIDKDILYNNIVNAILNGETTLDLQSISCYENPKYTANSKEVIDTKDILNKYVSSKITYTFGDKKEIIDKSLINKWLKVDESYEVIFDQNEMKKYLDIISNTYNTVGTTRNFVTSSGSNIKISGGDYGWIIDNEDEIKDLIPIIKGGQTTTRDPKYKQTAIANGVNDIGNTYVEINMTKQHLWYYKNGTLIADGDVVTGNVSNNHGTPTGIYRLKYKERNATLKGQGYSAKVSFWIPFNGGIGIHDASWRSEFGGNIYRKNGSHGCINAPYNLANAIFNNIEEGSPVICFYE